MLSKKVDGRLFMVSYMMETQYIPGDKHFNPL